MSEAAEPIFQTIDIVIIAAWMLFTILVGFWFSRRASQSTESFFVSGRSLPWWVIGTSMVATTFAADTPLAVSGFVTKAGGGIFENWVWWTFGLSGVCSVFLFAKLWRRSEVITDAELVELRYGDDVAPLLRAAKAFWFGVVQNLLIIAWVMSAMTKIAVVLLHIEEGDTILGFPSEIVVVFTLFLVAAIYTSAAGMWGVVTTDVVQFVIAITVSIIFGVIAWQAVGGLAGLEGGFLEHGLDWETTTAMVPEMGTDSGAHFLLYVFVIWWTMYNVDGGGYLAQRLFAAKDERHALWGYLWFTIAHICLRPWPWLIVGLAGLAMYGGVSEAGPVSDPEKYYPYMMSQLLPVGLFGLMVASFLAAFMSTIDTQLNWGASMVVHDIYRRFLKREADEAHYIRASRITILVLALLGAGASLLVKDIGWAWKLAFSVTSGLGTVYIARWYWWRTNAWSELSAMIFAALGTGVFWLLETNHPAVTAELSPPRAGWSFLEGIDLFWLTYPVSAAFIAIGSIVCWVTVTFKTRPASREHLLRFYAKVRPGGPGWREVASDVPGFERDGPTAATFLGILGAAAACYGSLLSVGWWITGRTDAGFIAAGIGIVGAIVAGKQVMRATATDRS